MKYIICILGSLLLLGCGSQPQPEPEATATLKAQDSFCGSKRGAGTSAAYYDASVSDKSKWGQSYVGIFDEARAQWGGISSNVALNKTSSTANNPDKYYVGTTSKVGRLGVTIGYDYVSGTLQSVQLNNYWYKANVSIYDNTFDSNDYSQTARLGTAIHELGHSLKLGHPIENNCYNVEVPEGRTSIMRQGRKEYGVQQYDAAELKRVWGI